MKKNGAVTNSERHEVRQKDRIALSNAKKQCNKPTILLTRTANTYISGGTEESRERLKQHLENYTVKSDRSW